MTPTAKKWLGITVSMAIVLGIVFAILAFMEAAGDAHAECVERGEHYFREIGSWPRLSDGRSAKAVAVDRCAADLKAF